MSDKRSVTYSFVIKASYGNDSVALIQWAREADLKNVAVLYNDTGWARQDWNDRVSALEDWVREDVGFHPHRTKSVGMEALVRSKKGWPRQGMQFCTQELKIGPTSTWLDEHDPERKAVAMIGVRREESVSRANFPVWSAFCGVRTWAPLALYATAERNALLARAGVEPLPTRSKECHPCVNSNRADLRALANDEERVTEIEAIETSLGHTSKGSPRTMFRPYRYQGATGIREIIRWANSRRGEFNIDDGEGGPGCLATGWCGL